MQRERVAFREWMGGKPERRFKEVLVTERFQGVPPMNTTWYERGQLDTLRKQLQQRFGPLSSTAQERFENLSGVKLEDLTTAILDAKTLCELGLED